ncbi:50S ribosomal protein L15 [Candidatus Wolfebacteria bacterium]|nr:MAG: 50S ribosomal protein L15 [Candidatus Wolfebacteria bacterium]
MQTHNIQRANKQKSKKTVGRGGLRGKTSGRGHKGQKQHGGHGIRPQIRDIIKKLPKLRGYRFSSIQTKPVVISLAMIEKAFDNGAIVSPKTLVEKSVIKRKKGRYPKIKIVGTGDIKKSVTIYDTLLSDSAKEKITKAGGVIK